MDSTQSSDSFGVLTMFGTLAGWEDHFAAKIHGRERSNGASHAPLLPVVPDRIIWDAFLVSVDGEWRTWRSQLSERPSCLLMLYCGLAFYEYDENRFWPQFAKVVGFQELPANQQSEINEVFATAARQFGLELKLRGKGTDFVGSAVNLIGIPLSLWDGFLEVCDWALWHKDWRTMSDEEWARRCRKKVRQPHTTEAVSDGESKICQRIHSRYARRARNPFRRPPTHNWRHRASEYPPAGIF